MGWTRIFDPLNITGIDSSAKDEANQQAADIANSAPKPGDPTWNPIFNPNTMSMLPGVEQDLSGINLDRSGLNKFQGEAMRTGPSDWARRAGTQQNYLAMNAKDQGAKTVAGQTAAGRASLASRGGLSGGAAERLAEAGTNNFLGMTQDVNNTRAGNLMQIGQNDEQNRISMLGQVPGMQAQAAGFDLFKEGIKTKAMEDDINNQVQNNLGKNQFDANTYNQKMNAYGAAQTAATTTRAGKHKK